jgi:integrase
MGRKRIGSIRYRGPNQYRAGIPDDTGKEISHTFDTEEEAKAWLSQVRAQMSAGTVRDWLSERECTLEQALRRYLKDITPQKKSSQTERNRIEAFIDREGELCKQRFHEVKTAHLKKLIERRMNPVETDVKPISGSTMNRELAFLSHLFTVAQAEWGWGMKELSNPVINGLRRPENPSRKRRLKAGEEEAILAAARAYERDCAPEIPIAAIIQFALATGMRLSEIGRSTWANVNLENRTVLLQDTKNGEDRTVPLYPSIVRLLSSLERREDGLVFGPPEAIRLMWTRVIARTAIEGLRFHDLRHEAISRLFERTELNDMEIAKISGHKTLSMLQRYAHLRANKLAKKLAAAEGETPVHLVRSRSEVDVDQDTDESIGRREWKAISSSRTLLEALVESRPVSHLAEQFGVSDGAIHKACSRLGVEKRPPGYWLKRRAA